MKTFHVFSVSNNYRCWSMERERKTTSKQLSVCVSMFAWFCSRLTDSGNQRTSGVTVLLTAVQPVHSSSFDRMFYSWFSHKHWTSTATMFAFTLFKSSTQFTLPQKCLISTLVIFVCTISYSLLQFWKKISFNNVCLYFVRIVTTIYQQTLNI